MTYARDRTGRDIFGLAAQGIDDSIEQLDN
jgi:hypothetical protein